MTTAAPSAARAVRSAIARLHADSRQVLGRRLTGAVAALAIEALLLLVLLALGQSAEQRKPAPLAITSFDAREEAKPAPKPEPEKKAAARAAPAPQRAPSPPAQPSPTPLDVTPMPQPAAIIPVSPQQMQSFDLAKVPRTQAPAKVAGPAYGPADSPRFGDSERVGTAPNGAAMYAARWYREPTDQELAGYLSTAEGPGWALITCKTVADFRVEDCVGLDEYPEGSRMLRAVLAAAWQFRVRPPQVGGVSQVGDWVRIRISYEIRRAPAYGDATKR